MRTVYKRYWDESVRHRKKSHFLALFAAEVYLARKQYGEALEFFFWCPSMCQVGDFDESAVLATMRENRRRSVWKFGDKLLFDTVTTSMVMAMKRILPFLSPDHPMIAGFAGSRKTQKVNLTISTHLSANLHRIGLSANDGVAKL